MEITNAKARLKQTIAIPAVQKRQCLPSMYSLKESRVLALYGYKFGDSGAHSARSLMHVELGQLFALLPAGATPGQYRSAIEEDNCLQKPTANARRLTYRHLVDLFGLDPAIPVFRCLRRLWGIAPAAGPLLALQVALVRDPLLRLSLPLLMDLKEGAPLTRLDMEALLEQACPGRFSPASLKSFAQNINGSWTQAGFLAGRAHKHRARPTVTVANLVMALFLAYLEGASGQRLMSSPWVKLLGLSAYEQDEMAMAANAMGVMDFRKSAGVTEARFPGMLSPEEESLRHE